MTPYITEILEQIDADPSLLETKYKDNYAVRTTLQYAFDKNIKMLLPEGIPPYKPDAAPLGMTPANYYQQVKKFYIFNRADLQPLRREQLFIQLLEGLHPSEAELCCLIKDQNLSTKYKNITADLVVKAGVVAEDNVFRQPVVQRKKATGGKTLVVNLSDTAGTKDGIQAPEQTKDVSPEGTPVKRGRGRPKKVKAE